MLMNAAKLPVNLIYEIVLLIINFLKGKQNEVRN